MKKIIILISFLIFSFGISGAASRLEIRNELSSLVENNIQESLKHKLKSEDIGEWKDIINDVLFALLRKTEVYRDKQKLYIIEENEASCAIYPDGSIFINTGLLEYIDEKLFTAIYESVRKVKNLNFERELFLAPFVAFEVARFALDIDVGNFIANAKNVPAFSLSADDVFVIDEFASILLKIAGYNSNLMEEYLSRLEEDALSYSFQKNVQVSIKERLNKLALSRQAIEKTSEEISNILFQLNTQKGIGEGLQSIELLKTSYPSSLYFLKLEAIANHSMYLESLNTASFIPLLPVAIIGYTYAEKYYINLENKLKSTPFLSNEQEEGVNIKRANSFLAKAIFLYEQYNDCIEDFSMLSSYFTLLAMTGDEKLKANSVEEVKSKMERKNTSLIEKVNYAIVLLISGQSVQKGVSLLEETLKKLKIKEENTLYEGIFFDERLVLYDYALSLSKLKRVNKQKITNVINELKAKLYVNRDDEPLVIRNLKIGDTTDELTKLWGEPSTIVYNYYFERWLYNYLKAMVVVSSYSTPPLVMQIILLPYSIVSLQNDIRTGDARKTFENTFGKSIYQACDYEVYFYEDKAIHVLYSSGGIVRSIAIFQAFKQGI
ncbi:MAG: hypothetical protein ACTTKH_02775 [Treponema sp.]